MNNLVYRRQFVLINKEIQIFDHWKVINFQQNQTRWFLYHHPDLSVKSVKNELFELVLIGYILDPENPEFDDIAILNNLLKESSFENIINATEKCNGRFVLIFIGDNGVKLFNDATGFREVYYTYSNEITACGSTPGILAELLNLDKSDDPDLLLFHQSQEYINNDYTWVGFRTLINNVFHLPSNHFFNLSDRQVIRFWPSEPITKIDIDTCAQQCARLIKGTIESANKRFALHMGLTAGWDTRLLLSATKDIKNDIFYYINKGPSLTDKSVDVVISKRLSKRLGFKMNIIDISPEVSREFREIFYRNNILAHEKLLPVFYEVYKRHWEHTYTISGTMGNGLARIYMRIPKGIEITGKNVARISGYHKLKYALSSLDEWVNNVKKICEDNDIDIMDLYQWEQENSHWASLASSEQDIVREEIRPFNNRHLIRLFWSLENKYRFQYNPIIYKKIMRILWKDVLRFPINPSLKTRLYSFLSFLRLEEKIYYFFKRRRFLKSIKIDSNASPSN